MIETMDQQTVTKLQELVQQGEKLAPEGGHEFSGYNAKMQSQYLMWRKSCLDTITKIGAPANSFREKITKDENGAYFYQNSAQMILDITKQTLVLVQTELKNSKPASQPVMAPAPKAAPVVKKAETKPSASPKESTNLENSKSQTTQIDAADATSNNQVLVLSSSESELQSQLSNLLKEMGIEAILFQRETAVDAIVGFLEQHPTVKYAYYLYNPDDINSAMFELGYLIGKVGSQRVCCIHKKDDAPPKGIPGIIYKEIVVKLEEISFGLMKDLKAAGYTVTF